MHKITKEERQKVAHLFDGIEDSMVIAYLQGYMGDGYVDAFPQPIAGMIISGEYSFFGGDAKSPEAKALIAQVFDVVPEDETTAIFAEGKGWEAALLSVEKNSPVEVPRFGIVQRDYDFDVSLLERISSQVPEGYEMRPFDKEIYEAAMEEEWSRPFCETFSSAEDFLTRGFGFAILKEWELVCGTSTMTVYDGGTETQVATREEHQGKGLALACSSTFVLECVRRGIRPCWDAANEASLHMALKLGYEYKGVYSTVVMKRG